ncbi:MAG: hypothetical protein WCX65_02720 [bacterium]
MAKICHLCGKEIKSRQEESREHIPPEAFFINRPEFKVNLLTLPTHKKCNGSFKKDEERFIINILGNAKCPGIEDAFWGNNLDRTMQHKFDYLKNKWGDDLSNVRWGEWDFAKNEKIKEVNGKYLPAYEVDRVAFNKIIWKITQGLFYWETKTYLPKTLKNKEIKGPHDLWLEPSAMDMLFVQLRNAKCNPNINIDERIIMPEVEAKKPNLNPVCFYYSYIFKRKKTTNRYIFNLTFLNSISSFVIFEW